ncbi:MAG TPA: CCA tRNA nucleotidyltransferase [Actinomycetota bacterium]|nr:CCA tRNA nucleotidyltransferase [Actinomycetota bacterium]
MERLSLTDLLAPSSPAMELAGAFTDAGNDLYLVGGPVRDAWLKRPHEDLDFATDATPEETQKIVKPLARAVWLQGVDYGTVGAEIAGIRMEITTFRTETYQPGSRHPKVDFATDIETDLSRRDFTINAMAIRLPDGKAIDPFGGAKDLAAGVIRTPLDPEISFSDDPLRMLRAFRFQSQLGLKIEASVLSAISDLREKILTVSAERIRDEFSKLVLGDGLDKALQQADATGITDLFLPELSGLKLEQDPVHKHKDVFHHTLAVAMRTRSDLDLRLAALLHDIGKPKTRKIEAEGVTFHHHEIEGARMAGERLRELRYPNQTVLTVVDLIRLHHRFHTYRLGWSDSAVRRYVRDAGGLLGLLNELVRADCTTRNPAKAKKLQARMDELEERIADLASREELQSLRPELDGVQIMAFLGVEPGPVIGEAYEFLLELRLEEGVLGTETVYERLDSWARERGVTPVGEKVPPKPKKRSEGD